MAAKPSFYLVDDDRFFIKLMSRFLEAEGYSVTTNTSSAQALEDIVRKKPSCALIDMMMPEIDGLEMIQRLREEPSLQGMKIIVVSGKSYEFDRRRAFEFGADGYIIKPVDSQRVVGRIIRIIEDHLEFSFWGVHGTLPVPGPKTVRYGGNTSCVSLEFSKGHLFIFDAGSGIKSLSDRLSVPIRPLTRANIFISHPHWDHINALPFFAPLYVQGNEIDIYGPSHGDITVRSVVAAQMEGVYFPVNMKEFGAMVNFHDLKEEAFDIDNINIQTMLLNHPGNCLGYRVQYKDRIFCYVTDNELFPEKSEHFNPFYRRRLTDFVRNADVLISDTTYLDKHYPDKMLRGHSAVSEVVALAHEAQVKTLYLFHHDPNDTDDTVEEKLDAAQNVLAAKKSRTQCVAPKEGQSFLL